MYPIYYTCTRTCVGINYVPNWIKCQCNLILTGITDSWRSWNFDHMELKDWPRTITCDQYICRNRASSTTSGASLLTLGKVFIRLWKRQQ